MGSGMSLPDFEHETAVLLPELPGDAAAPIKATAIDIDETIDWAAFSVWLSALLYARGDDIMRVKGVVQTPAGRLLLQSVRHVVQSPEILPDGGEEVDGKDNSIALSAGVSIPKACCHPCVTSLTGLPVRARNAVEAGSRQRLRHPVEEYTKMLLAAELPINRARHSALARVHAGFGRRCVLCRANASPKQGVMSCCRSLCSPPDSQNKTKRTNI
jgi:hypothetical protein